MVHQRRGVALRQHHVPQRQRDAVRVLARAAHTDRVHVVVTVDADLHLLHLQDDLVGHIGTAVLVQDVEHLRVSAHHTSPTLLHVVFPCVALQHAADQRHKVLDGQAHIVVAQLLKCVERVQHILLRSVLVTVNALNEPTLEKSPHKHFFLSSTFPKSNSCSGFFFCAEEDREDAFVERGVAALPKRCEKAINGCTE